MRNGGGVGNGGGKAMKGHQLSFSAEGLLAEARAITNIDIIDEDAVEPLTVMVKSLNEESQLHDQGAVGIQSRLLRLLCNRLRMERDFAAYPEIADQPIRAPIVICGMGRTGSTKLQKMLAASGDFNWLPYWQLHNPALFGGSREESPQPRIKDAEDWCIWLDQMSPEAKYGHATETYEPDEESYILEQSLRTACFIGWSEIPGYLQWLFTHDIVAQFHYLKRLLQYLQWQGLHSPDKRWILKCPLYFGLEPLLLSVFPDTCLVMTHRHPKETVPSTVRLLECLHMPFTRSGVDAQALLAGFSAQIGQHMQVRAQGNIRYLDLPFKQIVTDVPKVMYKFYAHCGVELGEASLHRMLDWNTANPMNKSGVHKYSLADYGFTEAMIDDAFSGYIKLISTL